MFYNPNYDIPNLSFQIRFTDDGVIGIITDIEVLRSCN